MVLPTEHPSRARDQARRHTARQAVISGSDGEPVGPTLGRLTGVPTSEWHPAVRAWYDAWRRSPQVRLFVSDVEWQVLARGAFLVAMFYSEETSPAIRVQLQNSIRSMEALLGATHTDRVRSHIKAKPPEAPKQAPVTDYRSMLAG